MLREIRNVLTCVAVLVATAGHLHAELVFTEQAGGTSPVPFGTIDASGNKTYIGSGLDLGADSNREVQLLYAPNGDLYGYNQRQLGSGSKSWGRINPTTGTFTGIGNLSNDFEASFSPSRTLLAFDSSGTLFATGFTGSSTFGYGTYDLTTGAFTQTASGGTFATSMVGYPVAVPEPSSLVMFGILSIFMPFARRLSRSNRDSRHLSVN